VFLILGIAIGALWALVSAPFRYVFNAASKP